MRSFLVRGKRIKMNTEERNDLSSDLVHWTKGADLRAAFDNLKSIISDDAIRGSNHLIKGSYVTVCFTETPICHFHAAANKYSPFGVRFPKAWAFTSGARPAIYQRDDEFSALPPTHQWRHVRYEPDRLFPIDFSWEREWRILTEKLKLSGSGCDVIVPSMGWYDELLAWHREKEENRIWGDGVGYGDQALFQDPLPFPFPITPLEGLC
jgi:hypothetical protein